MKHIAIAIALLSSCGFAQNTLTSAEKKQGWTLLFDGKTLKGWVDPARKNPPGNAWTVENGTIKAVKQPNITEDLFSNRVFGDFDLMFEWRVSAGGNSGVKYRIQDHLFLSPLNTGERFEESLERSFAERGTTRPAKGQDYVIGFEYQMTDDGANRDAKSDSKHTAGALYDMVGPSSGAAKPAGEWNRGRIAVQGKHVEHWLNGVKVVDASLDDPAVLAGIARRWTVAPRVFELLAKQPRSKCPISLQNHGDEAWFRGIKLKPVTGH